MPEISNISSIVYPFLKPQQYKIFRSGVGEISLERISDFDGLIDNSTNPHLPISSPLIAF